MGFYLAQNHQELTPIPRNTPGLPENSQLYVFFEEALGHLSAGAWATPSRTPEGVVVYLHSSTHERHTRQRSLFGKDFDIFVRTYSRGTPRFMDIVCACSGEADRVLEKIFLDAGDERRVRFCDYMAMAVCLGDMAPDEEFAERTTYEQVSEYLSQNFPAEFASIQDNLQVNRSASFALLERIAMGPPGPGGAH